MGQQTRIECPLCGMSKIESSFKRKDEGRYGTWDKTKAIIQIRDAPGGKAHSMLVGTGKYRKTPGVGFPIINSFTLEEAMDMPEYRDYVDMITEQLLKVVGVFYDAGLLSKDDLERISR